MACGMGVVGLGVMGSGLAFNMAGKGCQAAGYDLDPAKTQAFVNGTGRGADIVGVGRPERLMEVLQRPRRILIMLGDIIEAFRRNPDLVNLLLEDGSRDRLADRQDGWRPFRRTAVEMGIPVPATSASLAYCHSHLTARLPANLTQAQRDHVGAHAHHRVDRPGHFHTNWTARS